MSEFINNAPASGNRTITWQGERPNYLEPDENVILPGLVGDWTWINQGSATAAQNFNRIRLQTPAFANNRLRILSKTVSGGNDEWRFTAAFKTLVPLTSTYEVGICLLDNANQVHSLSVQWDGLAQTPTISVDERATVNSIPTQTDFFNGFLFGEKLWLEIEQDSVNRYFRVGFNGLDWLLVATHVLPDFINPTKYGFYVNARNAFFPASMELASIQFLNL